MLIAVIPTDPFQKHITGIAEQMKTADAEKMSAITVTKPFMPPLDKYLEYLKDIWASKNLTNGGPFHQKLETALAEYLGVPYVCLFNNATLALIVAMQALRIQGEVITTPYSFVATAHSVIWNHLTPVFVDIDKDSCCMDPHKIEQAITPKTSLIMPVHVYGRSCNTRLIGEIANNYGLRCIYDAAHAFGVTDEGGSILRHGDLSVLSFHATKVFNTFEGGAIVCNDINMKKRIDYLKNFGFANETKIVASGINGKMNELQAAFGLLQLDYIDEAISKRKAIDSLYRELLNEVPGIRSPEPWDSATHNYSYFPIFVNTEYPLTRDALYDKLKEAGVHARRYFYPLISNLPIYSDCSGATATNLPIANAVADEVLCLPIYPDLTHDEVVTISELVKSSACVSHHTPSSERVF